MGLMADIADVNNMATIATMTETNAAPTNLMRDTGMSQRLENYSTRGTRLQQVGASQCQEAINRRIAESMIENEEL